MKHIVIFGAGKSSTSLIDYLLKETAHNGWKLTVLDADEKAALEKTAGAEHAKGVGINAKNEYERRPWIETADLVISLLPPFLHELIAKDCVHYRKHLLTASYVDDKMKSLQTEIEKNNLLFLCEMGLDPGIDHMSAMEIIHDLRGKGAVITSFRSHCGGLVSPGSDDNPWHYKISWNPRNVVLAGKAGAVFMEDGQEKKLSYHELFNPANRVTVPGLGELAWYANRDSLSYIDTYDLRSAATFLRTTLRYPSFISGWQKMVNAGLTDEVKTIDTDRLSLKDFFSSFIHDEGNDPQFSEQLRSLGAEDAGTFINKGRCTAADVMQFILENRLSLNTGDRDMIVMLHEFEYILNGNAGSLNSSLIVEGEDHIHTAMAKTVGLPLAIAAELILKGTIQMTGLRIPVHPEIYMPVLKELQKHGISFRSVS